MSKIEFPSKKYKLDFWDSLDKSILDQPPRPANDVALYPSESSAVVTDEYGDKIVIGGCNRKSWFRNKLQRAERDKEYQTEVLETIEPEEFTAQTMWKFELGNASESSITEETKRAKIYNDNSHRFEYHIDTKDEKYGAALLRGEVDLVVLQDPNSENTVGIEIKSISGYHGQKQVFGNKSKYTGKWLQKPSPKMAHLLQTVLYCYVFCIVKKQFKYFKLAYLSRENGERNEFDVDLIPEELGPEKTIKHRVYVNQKPFEPTLYAEDILDRYVELHKMIVDDVIPPRDYQLQYSPARIQKLYNRKQLNKTDTAAFEAGKAVQKGDWMCSYCHFKKYCYNDSGQPIDYITE